MECHGRIDQMEVVHHAEPLSMSFCLECHRKPEESLRPMEQVTNLAWHVQHNQDESKDLAQIHAGLKIRRIGVLIPTQLHRLPQMIQTTKITEEIQGKQYWKSLDDLADTPGFRSWVDNEFPEGASLIDGVQRRGFLKVMAASFGLAGLGMTGCRRPEHTILPHGRSPEELIPGIPAYYSSSRPTSAGFVPLIIESHEGRPTKMKVIKFEAGGGRTMFTQASVLDLYDPDRARGCFSKESTTNSDITSSRWKKIPSSNIYENLSNIDSAERVAVLTDSNFSSVRKSLLNKLKQKGVRVFAFDPIDFHHPENSLAKNLNFSSSIRACPDFSKAKRVLSLDSDFLGHREPNSSVNTKQFMPGRKVLAPSDAKKMNRLYSVESDLSITGGVADHRLRLSSSNIEAFSALFLSKLLELSGSNETKLLNHLATLSKVQRNMIMGNRMCQRFI